MRYSLICYIINLRRNSLCQVKETKWESQFRNNDGDIPVRGSGNYQSDDAKEIAVFFYIAFYDYLFFTYNT